MDEYGSQDRYVVFDDTVLDHTFGPSIEMVHRQWSGNKTHHVARGTDLKMVQETLGHASLATTTLYVICSIGEEGSEEGATGARVIRESG